MADDPSGHTLQKSACTWRCAAVSGAEAAMTARMKQSFSPPSEHATSHDSDAVRYAALNACAYVLQSAASACSQAEGCAHCRTSLESVEQNEPMSALEGPPEVDEWPHAPERPTSADVTTVHETTRRTTSIDDPLRSRSASRACAPRPSPCASARRGVATMQGPRIEPLRRSGRWGRRTSP